MRAWKFCNQCPAESYSPLNMLDDTVFLGNTWPILMENHVLRTHFQYLPNFSITIFSRGWFFNGSSRFSVPKWKASCSQPEIRFQEVFNLKKVHSNVNNSKYLCNPFQLSTYTMIKKPFIFIYISMKVFYVIYNCKIMYSILHMTKRIYDRYIDFNH